MKNTLQKIKKYNAGETLAEVILSIAIFAIAATAVILLITSSFHGSLVGGSSTQATALARESFEAARSIGKNSYSQLASGVYGLNHASGTWAFADTPDVNGIFTRSVTVSDVYRDASGNISTSTSGTKDINTRKITSTLSWPSFLGTKKLSLVNYFTNWDSINTSQMQGGFGGGLFASTKLSLAVASGTTPTSSVQLTTANSKFWKCALVQGVLNTGTAVGTAITTYNYPAGGKYAFMIDAGGNFFVIDKSNPKDPTLVATVSTDGSSGQAIAISPDGRYAYVGTSKGNLVAINLSSLLSNLIVSTSTIAISNGPTYLATLSNGQGINKIVLSPDGTKAYLATDKGTGGQNGSLNFYVINLANPAVPAFFTTGGLGKGLLGAMNAKSVVLSTSSKYAFVVTDGDTLNKQLVVVNISSSTNPTIATSTNLYTSNGVSSTTANTPTDVTIYNTPDQASSTLYVVTANSSGSSGEFFEVDVSSSTKPRQTYNINLGNGADSVTQEGTNAIVGTPTQNGNTLQVVDTAPITITFDSNGNETDTPVVPPVPVLVLSINLSKQSYNGVFWDTNDKLLYAAAKDSAGQFQIVNRSGKINWGCMQKDALIKVFGTKLSGTGNAVFALNNNFYIGTKAFSKGPEFFIYDVTDPTAPNIPVKPGTVEIGADVNSIFVSNNFAFLATSNTSKPLQVFNVATPSSPTFVTSYNPGGNTTAQAVVVNGSTVLVGMLNGGVSTLYKLTVDGNGNLTPAGSLILPGAVTKIILYSNYAYVSDGSNAVEIIDYSNMTFSSNNISLGTNGNATGLWIKGKWLLVGSTGSGGSNGKNFFAYDISGAGAPPNAPTSSIASINLGSTVSDISASPDENFAFAGVNINGQEMKTIDLSGLLSTTTAPFIAASSTETTLGGYINDMYFYNNTIFLATNANTNANSGEAYIYGEIPGFAGFSTQFATNGTYTQNPPTDVWPFTGNQNVNWNTISWTFATSTGCTAGASAPASIKMQVRSATDQTTLATLPFEGPDGSQSSFMTDSAGSFIYAPDNTGTRYIQYLATLVSDTSCTPYLTSVTFNATKP